MIKNFFSTRFAIIDGVIQWLLSSSAVEDNTVMIHIPRESPENVRSQISIMRKCVNPKIWPFPRAESKNEKHKNVMCPRELITRKPKPTKIFLPSNEVVTRQNVLEKKNPESLYQVIGPILATAQLFGLLPVSGVCKSSPRHLSYRLLSTRTLYTISIIIMLSFMATLAVVHMIKTLNPNVLTLNGGIAAATAGVFFYGNSVFGTIIFWWLAPRWIGLQKQWRLMEQQFDSKQPTPQLRWKFRMITIMVMIPALAEHIISIVNNMPADELSGKVLNATWKDYLQLYAFKSHGFILSSCRYNITLGLFFFIISKIATFTWNFTDLFVMLISTALAERYRTLNEMLLNSSKLDHSNVDWGEYRKNYACLSTLVKLTDRNVSPIILLSFVNNLYFICLQLLNGLSPGEGDLLSSIYFFGSFGFLVCRTVAVTLLAARINDQSRMALPALYNCPAIKYNTETQRLQLQLTTDDVSLTGLRFFSITRNFMLAVGGAIVTYEVVLLQFNVAMNK